MIDGRLVHDLSLRCAQCARLRYPCQGGPGPRDHCRALGEQPALCRALGTPRRVRSSDDRLRVPKLTLHLVGMSRRGLRRRRARQPGRPGSARPLLGGRAAGSLLSDQGESGFHGPVALCSASSRTCAGGPSPATEYIDCVRTLARRQPPGPAPAKRRRKSWARRARREASLEPTRCPQPDAEGDGHADGSEVSVPEADREVALSEVVE